jgi:hypothetical protein
VDVDPEHGYQFREHPNRAGEGNGGDKTFEAAAFLERMRAMFVYEEGDTLWMARATPRSWLAQGQHIEIRNAPTRFGDMTYRIDSDERQGNITAIVEMPSRTKPREALLRLRHPRAARIRSVTIDGRDWTEFEPSMEIIRLPSLPGRLVVRARYEGNAR